MYISDLLEIYPYAVDFFEIFGLELSSKDVKLNSFLENINKNFFSELGIEKIQLMEHFQYFIITTERFKNERKIIVH